ncbi:transporter, major facilitator family protein [Besnoitia besnoiti]|uniref:Transporter, major facilitator family protein n=1 Tax=Besnoitia besnoiti TaxID=94643 RepID=A0A2A9MII2_BESBE|nr:transporter, major facilitator family protein [Besnoitia besnoiti]PFH35776.1 transporter, major facilitator family protein [Besnoitia besnoiti]
MSAQRLQAAPRHQPWGADAGHTAKTKVADRDVLYDLPLDSSGGDQTTNAVLPVCGEDRVSASHSGFTSVATDGGEKGRCTPGSMYRKGQDDSASRGQHLCSLQIGAEKSDERADALQHAADGAQQQSLLVPCLAVFSSNYNFTVTSIALFLMNQDPVYKEASESVVGSSTVKMLSYAGAIVGMCTMGYLGDLIGRRLAMIFTLALVFIGAFLSSICTWGNGVTVLVIMGVCRFILGVGSGGVYPLSAVSAAEGAGTERSEDRSMRVSWAYSMNVPGIMFPYIVALVLWSATHNVDTCFRVLLAFGALPALLIWLPAWRVREERNRVAKDFGKHLVGVFVSRNYWRQLLGTGVCWLLYDVTAYGILLVQPEITQSIWGDRVSVTDVIWQNIILNGMGIPGCFMGILVLKQMGVKWLQFWGFIGLATSAFLLAGTAHVLRGKAWAQLILLCTVNFFINWGASITTFILPSLVFPPEVRSTYSGISAALGKIGAVGGIYAMKAILSAGGLMPMMICAGLPSLAAAVLTWFYVDPVPNTLRSSFLQSFGSLGGACPFVDCRKSRRGSRTFM